jgi:hypothetical protein
MSSPMHRTPDRKEPRVELKRYGGPQLWTRQKAREIRADITQELEELAVGGTLVLDAGEIEVFDYSFANELFGKTLLSVPVDYPGRFVVVENLTEYTRENLAQALESLGLIIAERAGETTRLLGKVHPADEETFCAVQAARRAVSASELKDRFRLNATAMNERLSKLVRLGLLRRDKAVSSSGREQYQYSTFV